MRSKQQIVIQPEWRGILGSHGLDTMTAVYSVRTGTVAAASASTEVRRLELRAGAQSRTVFLKKYWVTRRDQLWSGFWRGAFFGTPKVVREFENMRRLREWGLDAPSPIAYGLERRGRWLIRSFLLSEAVPNPLALDIFIRDQLGRQSARRRALIDQLARYTRRLHEHQFVHHDYYWRNIILSGDSLEHFYLIDAHKGRVWRPSAERRSRAQDLATLDAPAPRYFRRTERLRFFLQYLDHTRLRATDKPLLRLVLKRAAPERENQLRRVRQAGLK